MSNFNVKIALISLLITSFSTFSFTKHEEYYSITNIDYKPSSNAFNITMRLFTNDVEKAINELYDINIEIGTDRELREADENIDKYLKSVFAISTDGKLNDYTLLGKEFKKDMVYLYVKVNDVKDFKSLNIKNTVLIETFPKQENIVKINAFGGFKTIILTKNHQQENILFYEN